MDRVLYTASNGAARILEQQSVIANNMANVGTTGFREQLAMYRSVPVVPHAGELPTRVSTVAATPGSEFSQGAMVDTGHSLDAAIAGEGWFAVRTPEGGEAYTRAGEFAVNQQNQLVTQSGLPVLANGGEAIEIPDRGSVTFASDGQISALGAGDNPRDIQQLAQLKLVNPPKDQLVRGDDGLFRLSGGQPAQADPLVRIAPGFVEKSNVNPAAAMVAMISNARQFELQMQVIKNATSNEDRGNSILSAVG
ncbi:flagellar basal-body rod protein FlgF [Castellaniella caeni]|uniref:flagellar basal-body rod protein FlgF n=1 Tax=Castellaniella caeni TaxID=266123 RepID=UPI00082AAC4F|nr:flagellar basal-body rod protein FlgF [Castellaniella caeni]